MKYILISILFLISLNSYSQEAPVEQSVATTIDKNQSLFYLGGLLGNATTKEQFENTFTAGGQEYRQEGDNFTFGLYAGFNFAKVWALETSITITSGLDKRPSSLPLDDVYLTAITLTPVIHFDLTESIALYAKAGIGFLIYVEDYKKHSVFNHQDGDYWAGVGFAVGAGLDFKVSKDINFRLGFDYIEAEMDADEENHHINLDDIDEEYSLVYMGMQYNF